MARDEKKVKINYIAIAIGSVWLIIAAITKYDPHPFAIGLVAIAVIANALYILEMRSDEKIHSDIASVSHHGCDDGDACIDCRRRDDRT